MIWYVACASVFALYAVSRLHLNRFSISVIAGTVVLCLIAWPLLLLIEIGTFLRTQLRG